MTDDRAKAAFDVGRLAWPTIRGPTLETFRSFVDEASVDSGGLDRHAGDLFLAAAAAAGDRDAATVFEAQFLSQLPRWLSRFQIAPDVVDEVRQCVRTKLFVGPPPKLRQYRAEGPLGGWVRITSIRTALDIFGTDTAAVSVDENVGEPLLHALSPEQLVIKHRYGALFEGALRDALGGLSKRDRNLLRFHYLASMSYDTMARTYHVHRATVVRWLAAIRDELETAVRIQLWEQSGISPSEFHSLWNAVKSDIEVSMSRLLAGE